MLCVAFGVVFVVCGCVHVPFDLFRCPFGFRVVSLCSFVSFAFAFDFYLDKILHYLK